ncbi:MAG: arginine repressor [Gaiellaceae bacterium MAG52_C11]|nr:arginine repressor [Candidatus Gaiellasilicea maunaloa]
MKRRRHDAILELVRSLPLSTQAEVAEALRTSGFEVVQTTVSRDIAELGLVKVRAADGRLVYAPAGSVGHGSPPRLGAAVRRFALSVEAAGALVVLRTPSGYASALAQALDEAALPTVAGTIAGDNTIFVAPRDGTAATALAGELQGHLLEGAA